MLDFHIAISWSLFTSMFFSDGLDPCSNLLLNRMPVEKDQISEKGVCYVQARYIATPSSLRHFPVARFQVDNSYLMLGLELLMWKQEREKKGKGALLDDLPSHASEWCGSQAMGTTNSSISNVPQEVGRKTFIDFVPHLRFRQLSAHENSKY